MKPLLTLGLLLAVRPGFAADASAPGAERPGAAAPAQKAAPELISLEGVLTRELAGKKAGRVSSAQYQEWTRKFREQLDAVMTRVPPAPENVAARVRIMAQLGDRRQAQAALSTALGRDPKSPVLLRTQGTLLYEQKDYPGAAKNALQAWEKSGRTDKRAWTLYQMSKDRDAGPGKGEAATGTPQAPGQPARAATSDAGKPYVLPVTRDERAITVPGVAPDASSPPTGDRKWPLWPLSLPIAGGLIGYGVYRGLKKAGEQESGGKSGSEPGHAPQEALLTAPLGTAAPTVLADGAAEEAGTTAAATAAGDIAAAGSLTAGILVVAGVIVIGGIAYGLNRAIATKDAHNDSINTHRNDRQLAQQPPDGAPGQKPDPRPAPPLLPTGSGTVPKDCSLKSGEDILDRFIDGTRLSPGFLQSHEGPNKGHTIRDHVNQKLPDLLRQINIGKRNAGSYPDISIAERITRQTIEGNAGRIETWYLSRSKTDLPVPYAGDMTRSTGYSISEQNPRVVVPTYDAVTVLRKLKNCRILILTSYPR
jgi:hypothetical protein